MACQPKILLAQRCAGGNTAQDSMQTGNLGGGFAAPAAPLWK